MDVSAPHMVGGGTVCATCGRGACECADEEVLQCSLSHPSVFAVLVDRYEDAFLRKAERILQNREDAQDAVQETFVKLYAHAPRFGAAANATFRSWAYAVLKNTCFSHYRLQKRARAYRKVIDPARYNSFGSEDGEFEGSIVADRVATMLSRLPHRWREVLTLRFLGGRTNREIALAEDTTEGAIKTRVYRAKKELNRIINEYDL